MDYGRVMRYVASTDGISVSDLVSQGIYKAYKIGILLNDNFVVSKSECCSFNS